MGGTYKYPTISFCISPREREEIEAKIFASGMKKKDYFVRSCIYNRVCVVGKKETVYQIVEKLQEMQNRMVELAEQIKKETPEVITEEMQEISWLWYPFIPYGKLTIVQGDPGDGKTTLVLNIAAKLSKGEALDSEMILSEPLNVIYQSAEDGLADTVKPRLEMAGTDYEKISVIDESIKSLSMIDERLEEAVIRTKARLLILEPIQAYLGGGMDMEMRNLIDWICVSEQIKINNNIIRNLTGEYKKIEPDCREGVRAQLGRMKELCKERNNIYEKQNDLKGQNQKIEKSLER